VGRTRRRVVFRTFDQYFDLKDDTLLLKNTFAITHTVIDLYGHLMAPRFIIVYVYVIFYTVKNEMKRN